MAADAVCGAWDTAVRAAWETWGPFGSWTPGYLRDDSWTRFLGTRPWRSCQLRFASSQQDLNLGEFGWALETFSFLSDGEKHLFDRFTGTWLPDHDLTEEQRLWNQEVCNNSPYPSHTIPRKGHCWELLVSLTFLTHMLPISLVDSQ